MTSRCFRRGSTTSSGPWRGCSFACAWTVLLGREKRPPGSSRAPMISSPTASVRPVRRLATLRLVEVVGCRTCGYLYGALQDRGPRETGSRRGRATPNMPFDSFSTDLGEDNEAFRSYFTIEGEMPSPGGVSGDDEEDDADDGLIVTVSKTMAWCATCGLRIARGESGACKCLPGDRHARTIQIVHRQCETDPDDRRKTEVNLRRRRLMRECPNCHYKRVSVEPVQRYREWRDEMGAAMALPLSYFQMRPPTAERKTSKLLCFTDNRQRAAAFPAARGPSLSE